LISRPFCPPKGKKGVGSLTSAKGKGEEKKREVVAFGKKRRNVFGQVGKKGGEGNRTGRPW